MHSWCKSQEAFDFAVHRICIGVMQLAELSYALIMLTVECNSTDLHLVINYYKASVYKF